MAAWYKRTLGSEHEESAVQLLLGRRSLRHELHYVSRLQGNIRSGHQLFGVNSVRDAVVQDDYLAGVFSAVIISGEHGLGQGQTFRPQDDPVPDLAIDRDAGALTLSLSLLHSHHRLLLPGHKGGSRPRVGLALGHTAPKRDRQEQRDARAHKEP